MKLDEKRLEKLRQRFAFAQWAGTNKLRRNLFIWKYKMSQKDLPSWIPVRVQRLSLPEEQRLTTSVWKRSDNPLALIGIDVYECESRDAAHDLILVILDNFQSPLVEYNPNSPAGDVAFSDATGNWILFSRANLIVIIRNAGRAIEPVSSAASSLDSALSSEPPVAAAAPVGERAASFGAAPFGTAPPTPRVSMKSKKASVGSRIRLQVETPEVLNDASYLKIFSKSGDVYAKDDGLYYRPEKAEEQDVVLYTVGPEAIASSQVLRVDARAASKSASKSAKKSKAPSAEPSEE